MFQDQPLVQLAILVAATALGLVLGGDVHPFLAIPGGIGGLLAAGALIWRH